MKTWTIDEPSGVPCCTEDCCCEGTQYTSTSSGWMDMSTFLDWFLKVFLPHAKKLSGNVELSEVSLASHFSAEVIRLCREQNIDF